MAKFRKKPVVIEAEPFRWGLEDGVIRFNEHIPRDGDKYAAVLRSTRFPGYLERYHSELSERGFESGDWQPYIETLEDKMRIGKDDWIITGVKNERYPCKPDIFEATYEAVEE